MIDVRFNDMVPKDFVDFLVGEGQPAINVTIKVEPAPASISWEIKPQNKVSGTLKLAKGSATSFSIAPSVASARKALKSGSRTRNEAVGYTVTVTATHLNKSVETGTFTITQDEISILRQEYIDFGGTPPARDRISLHEGSYNVGNYRYVVNLSELQDRHDRTISAYRGRAVKVGKTEVAVPSDASVTISSAYRNPRRNVAAGSKYPITSHHVQGTALDSGPRRPAHRHGGQAEDHARPPYPPLSGPARRRQDGGEERDHGGRRHPRDGREHERGSRPRAVVTGGRLRVATPHGSALTAGFRLCVLP
ncbi:MAG: hypothetical protein QM820_63135 [Minicystis sp.]